jgi:SAM-dependent MidA family methyltransferase
VSALAIACGVIVSLVVWSGGSKHTAKAASRDLVNSWDVRNEIKLAPGVDPATVKNYFPSFYDYVETVLFHPTAGYYSSGRVNFFSDYQTFPIALGPSFGQMVAEQMFRMWDGMRTAGTLSPTEKFTIAEFGAGDGAMAESVLEYIDEQAASNPDERWKEFRDQTVYACYDRSPALSETQRKRNSRFGARFEARQGDATNPGATIAPGSLKGVILSNELPDCFSVEKVIVDDDGIAEVAYPVPSLSNKDWTEIGGALPAAARDLIVKDNDAVYRYLFADKNPENASAPHSRVYLSRAGFAAILDAFSGSEGYEDKVKQLQFQELYVPISVNPELAEYFRKYAHAYAYGIARSGKGQVTYVNLGEGKFIKGAGAALKAGYVITIDYGDNWDGILEQKFDHLRMYGPGSLQMQANPYHAPTLNDMTTDVNFSHVAEEGKSVGLQALYFGPQHSLQVGTPIDLNKPPASRSDDAETFQEWADQFYSWEVYKVMIQQKENTDAAYRYLGDRAEPLTSKEELSSAERTKLAEIEKNLRR